LHIIGGTASTALAERVSRRLSNAPFGIPFTKRFPDGEMYVRVGGRLEGEDVVVIQSTRTDADLLELFFLVDAARERGPGTSRSSSPTSATPVRTACSSRARP